ncbi:hypothetical protein TH63_09675 [Rufibacter radiotolerans]|uniref:PKD domain-containing protein n=1 Tax=Rufibacter radiotolerans TaxID=1379910 RepID=A0A0H4WAU8_9BACT|nr:hypothetical protein TH63_09675 [Rufibacter radiotolerans]
MTPLSPTPVCQGTSVLLTANATSDPAGDTFTYQWVKDGVDIPNATQSTFSATASGNYLVRVSSSSSPPCTVSSVPVTVTVNPIPATPDFITNPTTAQCSGSPIQFTVTNPSLNTSYVWDFGDGSTTVGTSVSHTYTAIGAGSVNFPVTVYGVSQAGCRSANNSRFVTINRKPGFTAPKDSSNFQVCVEEKDTIKVKASLLNNTPVPNDITQYIVDFGDGAGPKVFLPDQFTSTTPIRNSVPYDTTGAFKITIRAIGANGCDSVYTKDFKIDRKPKADFDARSGKKRLIDNQCTPVIIAIQDTSTGGNLTYRYRVTNSQGQPPSGFSYIQGTDSTSREPVLRFDIEGRYTIRLIVSNSCGQDTATQSALIARPEVMLFADSTVCGPATILFDAQKVEYDINLGKVEKSFAWSVSPNTGVTFVNGTTAASKFPEIRFGSPGTFKVTVITENECGNSRDFEMFPAEATITINPLPTAVQFTANSVTICNGDSTTIRPSGPGTSFEFYTQETGGTSLFSGRELKTTGLSTTTVYYVTAKNTQGCESPTRTPFTVNVVPAIGNNTISLTKAQEEICAGKPFPRSITGTTPTGGGGTAFTYTWQSSTTGPSAGFGPASGTSTPPNFTPNALTATTWFRRIVATGSCSPDTSNVVMVNVVQPPASNTISIAGKDKATICQGNNAPQITGSPSGNFTVIWQGSTTSTTAGFSDIAASRGMTDYSPGALTATTWFRRILSTTAGGCSDSSAVVQVVVVLPIGPNTIQSDQTLCSTTSAPAPLIGSTITGGGTAANRTITWESSLTGNANDFTPITGANAQNYTPPTLIQTTYFRRTIRLVEGDCAPSISNVVVITIVPPITGNSISATQTNVCQGAMVMLTGTTAAGGNGELEYLWESSTTSATTGFTPAPSTATNPNNGQNYTSPFISQDTWYRRTVLSKGTACPPDLSNVIAVTVEKAPATPTAEAPNVQTCPGVPATLRVSNPVAGVTYEWFTQQIGGTPVFSGPEVKTGPLSSDATFYVQAVSSNQCKSINRASVKVTVVPIVANAGRDTTIIQGQAVPLRATGGTTYVWTPTTGLSNPNIANPIATPTVTTTYTVTVSSTAGCEATDEITITVLPRIKIVNTFSPNRDGINEVWEIENIENFPEATVEIFNRYGAQVYKSTGNYVPWDGTHNGSPLPLATYYYIIRLNKDDKPFTGSVTIIR